MDDNQLTSIDAIRKSALKVGLEVLAGVTPKEGDRAPENCKTLLLLGPSPDFWTTISASPEMLDGDADPVDRWSTRVVGKLAQEFGGEAHFPFGGPPYLPFYSWALASGHIWSSPVHFAVHATHGLFVSFRGAISLPRELDLPPASTKPCDACSKPCLTACPVGALSANGYDVEKCHSYLDTPKGRDCMEGGCLVRRSCPLDGAKRDLAQSAYHMRLFHKK